LFFRDHAAVHWPDEYRRHGDDMDFSQTRRAMIWAILAIVVALLCLAGFRGYLSSDLLLNFANLFYC
jgi:hypothetical protein